MGKRTQSFVFSDSGNSSSRRIKQCIWLGIVICLSAGCSQLKGSLITGATTATVVGVTSVLSPGVIVPAIIGGSTAAIVSAITAEPQIKGEPLQVTADTVVQEAPANFWSLLGQLIEVGGWALILIVLVPMVFSWLMPGPIKFKGREKNNGS